MSISKLLSGHFSQLVGQVSGKFNRRRKLASGKLHKLRAERRSAVNGLSCAAHGRVGSDEPINPIGKVAQQIQFWPELIKLDRSAYAFARHPFSRLMVALEKGICGSKTSTILPRCGSQCGSHYSNLVAFKAFLIIDCMLPLAPRDVNGNADCGDTADRLNPGRPLNTRHELCRSPVACYSPGYNYAGNKCHYRDNGPVPIGTSLLHGWSPIPMWILAFEATA